MCLITKDNKTKIAETDITVYKCFRSVKENYSSKKYRDMRTLFLDFPVSYDEMTGKTLFIGRGDKTAKYRAEDSVYEFGSGYVHAFMDRETAKMVMQKYFIGNEWYFPVVAKVTIPAGTEYLEGTDSHGEPCIAAERIVIGKCLDCLSEGKIRDFNEYVNRIEKAKAAAKEKRPFE